MTLTGEAIASENNQRTYDKEFFDQFAPQTALEMIVRLPGFALQEADEDRGLSQGGTNVLLNGRPVTGKGEAATTQLSQIAASSVVRIEILDAGTLDLPGFSGLVANIVTQRSSISGSFLWEPEFKRAGDPAWGNGNINISGSRGNVDFSAALNSTMVRRSLEGPETLTEPDGIVFETRDEVLSIRGTQPDLSGGITWNRPNGHILNAKASFNYLDLDRRQTSITNAVLPRGVDSLNIGAFAQEQKTYRFDTDYTLPAFDGSLKLIGFASLRNNDASTRLTIDNFAEVRVVDQGFNEESTTREGILRFEQNWKSSDSHSWQLAGEAVYNDLDLETDLLSFSTTSPNLVTSSVSSETRIEEIRGEVTIAHRRSLSVRSDLQFSLGGETSTIKQGDFERDFLRPKGFVSYTLRPEEGWTVTARAAREVGQINFRDFAATVSLFEEVIRENNPELVPQQSWLFSGRAEHRFSVGHVASLSVEHELITDLVDRIPLGDSGDAIGNISEATRSSIEGVVTLLGAPFGLKGMQLDLRGKWQWSSLDDPIQGFTRDIANLRTRDLKAEFRHDIPGSNWSYGFTFQDIELAPVFQSTLIQARNVPGGGLTPGENSVFVEHKDVFGLRTRLTLSEFIGQESRFSRVIHGGRRDIAPINRIEDRERSLGGPFVTLSLGKAF